MTSKMDEEAARLVYDKIPVRNVWFLFLYAYDLTQFEGSFNAEIEDSPNDFKLLIARLLCHVMEVRIRRNLSHGYRRREDILKRVRGRIDLLRTYSHELLQRGEIACRFEEFTIDTPRNRFIWAALDELGRWLKDNNELAHQSGALAGVLARAGVSGVKPSKVELDSDQIGRHEAQDRLLVSLAKAVFDLILPTEEEGPRTLLKTRREDTKFRKLFERAVGKFLELNLRGAGWYVHPGKQFEWPASNPSQKFRDHLPIMITDIILENERENRRIIIDTKFTDILTKKRHSDGHHRFKTQHIYQIYSYLRSQECDDDPRTLNSEGMLLYPSIGFDMDERAEIQGHTIRFCTLDLNKPTDVVVNQLRNLPYS